MSIMITDPRAVGSTRTRRRVPSKSVTRMDVSWEHSSKRAMAKCRPE